MRNDRLTRQNIITTSLKNTLRRAALLLTLLAGWGSNAVADTRVDLNVQLSNSDTNDGSKIALSEFSSYDDACVVEFTYQNTITNYNIG